MFDKGGEGLGKYPIVDAKVSQAKSILEETLDSCRDRFFLCNYTR